MIATLLKKQLFLVFTIVVCFDPVTVGQKAWAYNGHVNFGANVHLTRGKAQKFPGIRFFGAFIATARKGDFFLSYGPSISIYTRTIGANLNPLVGDFQIDVTNTFNIGAEWGEEEGYNKFTRTIHNGDFYNFCTRRSGMIMVGTNFILNNHKRNQVVGSINANVKNVSVSYYNDGPPFDFLGLGDNFDRYWTGGFAFFVHNKKNYNSVEFSFDQFTGYTPLLYEIAGKLGIRIPLYDQPDKRRNYNYNTSAYSLRVNLDNRFSVSAGVMGSLQYKKRYYGLQEIIHIKGRYPLHPNDDGNRLFFGGGYNQYTNVKL